MTVSTKVPYPYQAEAILGFKRWFVDPVDREALIALTVGMGKTFTSGQCCRWILEQEPDNTILWITHRSEILDSTETEIEAEVGVKCMVEKAERKALDGSRIVLASVQTLHSRRLAKLAEWFSPKLIVFDEAHHAVAKTWIAIKQAFPHAKVLNLTATPYRQDVADELNLGRVLIKKSTSDGIALGVLVPPKPVATLKISLKKVKIDKGDFEVGSLGRLLSRQDILDKSCDSVAHHIPGRKALIFAASVEHGKLLTEGLRARGLLVEEVYADTPLETRRTYYAHLKIGAINAIVNNACLTEGFNLPEIDFVAIFRPTKSASLFLQMLGRGLRACGKKRECYVIDVADTSKTKVGGERVVLPNEEDQKKFSARRGFRSPASLVFLSWFFKTQEILDAAMHTDVKNMDLSKWSRLRTAQSLYEAVFDGGSHTEQVEADTIQWIRPLYSRGWKTTSKDVEGYQALLYATRINDANAFVLHMKHRGWRYCPHEEIDFDAPGGGGREERDIDSIDLKAIFQDDPVLRNFVTDIFDEADLGQQASNCYEPFDVAGQKTLWIKVPDREVKAHFISDKHKLLIRRFDGLLILVERSNWRLRVLTQADALLLMPAMGKSFDWASLPMTEAQKGLVQRFLELDKDAMEKLTISRLSATAIISAHLDLKNLRDLAPRIAALNAPLPPAPVAARVQPPYYQETHSTR